LSDFAGLSTSVVTQRQLVNVEVSWELIKWHLNSMFGGVVEGLSEDKVPTLRIMKVLNVKRSGQQQVILEWESSASNDMIADSALALILGIDRSPASVKLTSRPCKHAHSEEPRATYQAWLVDRAEQLRIFFTSHLGEVDIQNLSPDPDQVLEDIDERFPRLVIHGDNDDAVVNILSLDVSCSNDTLRTRVERILQMAIITIDSLDESFNPIDESIITCMPQADKHIDSYGDSLNNESRSVLGKRKNDDNDSELQKTDQDRDNVTSIG